MHSQNFFDIYKCYFDPTSTFSWAFKCKNSFLFFGRGGGKRTIKNRIPRLESFWYTYAPISYQKLSKYVSMSPNNARIPFQTEIRWQSQISPPPYCKLRNPFLCLPRPYQVHTGDESAQKSTFSSDFRPNPPFLCLKIPF